MPALPRLVVLLSGGGTTFQNLLDRTRAGSLAGEIVGVVSSKADAFGVERARRAGVPVAVAKPKEDPFPAIAEYRPDLVVLAGWVRLLAIPLGWSVPIVNVHPSLLPAFGGHGMYGRRVHEAVLAAGVTESGCTVHLVDATYDTGPILLQSRVPVLQGDTPEALAERVQAAEREAYPAAIAELLRR